MMPILLLFPVPSSKFWGTELSCLLCVCVMANSLNLLGLNYMYQEAFGEGNLARTGYQLLETYEYDGRHLSWTLSIMELDRISLVCSPLRLAFGSFAGGFGLKTRFLFLETWGVL
jgi:hypothetical protein